MKGHVAGVGGFPRGGDSYGRTLIELVTCKLNDAIADGASTAFQYYDRQKTLDQGADSVSGGKFASALLYL